MCEAHFIHRRCTSYARHTSLARRANFIEKSTCFRKCFFLVGEDGFVCIFIPLWGMKIKVLTPSSRRQATVPRTVAFWIFESALQPSKRTKRPIQKGLVFLWWGRTDSNHRSETQQIYSLSPLATRELPHMQLSVLGAGRRTRTPDLLITNQLLYRLSYTGSSNRTVRIIA